MLTRRYCIQAEDYLRADWISVRPQEEEDHMEILPNKGKAEDIIVDCESFQTKMFIFTL